MRIGVALFLAALLPSGAAAEPTVTAARIGDYPSKTRFVLDLTRGVSYRAFTLADPYRVVIDLPVVAWGLDPGRRRSGGLIAGFNYGLFRDGVSRIVLHVGAPVRIAKSFQLAPHGRYGHRLVVDLVRIDRAAFLRGLGRRTDRRPRAAAAKPPWPPAPAAKPKPPGGAQKGAKKTVAIDPGHGGVDPGTIGVSGALEKHLVLAQARALRRRLLATGRYRVVMTRDRDVSVPLRQRIARTRAAGADMFISLHADSLSNRRVRGGSIYTLSEKASDKEAAALAAKENKADLIAGIDLSEHSPEVVNILITLAQRRSKEDSVIFAKYLTKELGRSIRLLRNTHRFAGFAVLKAPDVPSVLVELGYLSNAEDERLLRQRRYRVRVAGAIVRAIETYFAQQHAYKRP